MISKRKQKSTGRASSAEKRKASAFTRALAKLLIWGLGLALAAGVVVGAVWGLRLLLFTKNPHFIVRRITVNATGQMTRQEVERLAQEAGVRYGQSNLFSLDLARIRRHVEGHVLVDRAVVARRLPDELAISVYERQPVAQFVSRGGALLDAEGWLLPPQVDGRFLILPVITGVRGASRMKVDTRVTDDGVAAALRFLRLIATRADGQFYDVALIQLDNSSAALKVRLRPKGTFRKGAMVVVPYEGMEEALDRMAVIVKKRMRNNQKTRFIDATYEVNIPIKP